MADASVNLPPGFRFSPTDEELILHFLYRKASLLPCQPNIIPDLDLSLLDPWLLNGKALSSGKQYYFFTKLKEESRETKSGYWKEMGISEPIFSAAEKIVGIKKYLAFNIGEEPDGAETNWVMQEYHLCTSGFNATSTRGRRKSDRSQGKWVLCRVYEREGDSEQGMDCYNDEEDSGTELSWLDEVFLSLDEDLEEISLPC